MNLLEADSASAHANPRRQMYTDFPCRIYHAIAHTYANRYSKNNGAKLHLNISSNPQCYKISCVTSKIIVEWRIENDAHFIVVQRLLDEGSPIISIIY